MDPHCVWLSLFTVGQYGSRFPTLYIWPTEIRDSTQTDLKVACNIQKQIKTTNQVVGDSGPTVGCNHTGHGFIQ